MQEWHYYISNRVREVNTPTMIADTLGLIGPTSFVIAHTPHIEISAARGDRARSLSLTAENGSIEEGITSRRNIRLEYLESVTRQLIINH